MLLQNQAIGVVALPAGLLVQVNWKTALWAGVAGSVGIFGSSVAAYGITDGFILR